MICMTLRGGALILLGIALLAPGCKVETGGNAPGPRGEGSATSLDPRVAATVNGDNVLLSDLAEYLQTIGGATGHSMAVKEGQRNQLVTESLNRKIEAKLLAQAARKEGVDRDPAFRAVAEARVVSDLGKQYLGRVQKQINDGIRVDDEEVKMVTGSYEDRWKFRVFFSADRNEAEEIRFRAFEGEDFAELVATRSTGISAVAGGDLGYTPKAMLPTALHAFDEGLLKMKPGDVSPVMNAGIGFVVYKLEDVRWFSEKDIRNLQDQTREDMKKQRFQREIGRYYDNVVKRYDVRYSDAAFRDIKDGVPYLRFAPLKEGEIAVVEKWPVTREAVAAVNPLLLGEKNQKMLLPYVQDQATFRILFQEGVRTGYLDRPRVERETGKVEESLLAERMRDRIIAQRVAIGDEDVRKYYRQTQKDYVTPKTLEMTLILVSDKDRAMEVRDRIREGAEMGGLAAQYSEERNSSKKSGKISIPQPYTPQNILDRAAMSLKPGEVSEPVAFNGKYYILRLDRIVPSRTQEYGEVRDGIRDKLLREERKHVVERYIEERKKASTIQINYPALSGL